MLYRVLRPLLFLLPPEAAHHITLGILKFLYRAGLSKIYRQRITAHPVQCAGLTFKNPMGIAAGLDKDADYVWALAKLGVGFIEVGTVTPLPQPGQQKPRLFRIVKDRALLNRFGFNSKGVDYLVERLRVRRVKDVIIGINIGKNAVTPMERAVDDYVTCFDKVYPYADYITANISSPNTEQLRALQFSDALNALLAALKARQAACAKQYGFYKPLFIKVSPDISDEDIASMAACFITHRIDGVIATNTTVARDVLSTHKYDNEKGGVSGAVLKQKASHVLSKFHEALHDQIPLIGVGGIDDVASAIDRLQQGATLIQLYSGLIYEGPALIKRIAKALRAVNK